MKLERIQILSIVLLLGSFLYLFEIFYHGFVQGDFNKVQIILTFLLLFTSGGLLVGYQMLEGTVKKKELLEMGSFLGLTMVMLFSIFYTRNSGTIVPLVLAAAYFGTAVFLMVKKDFLSALTKSENPMISFASRFFIVLGMLILPAAGYEYWMTGSVNFKFDELYMPLIGLITYITEKVVTFIGVPAYAIEKIGGYDLISSETKFRVFIGAFCSGVTSMAVFIAAFIAMSYDLKVSHARKMFLFAIGIIGTFLANVIRVVVLFLVGYYYGSDALLTVHTHLGWIIFFIWITIFWMIALKDTGSEASQTSKKPSTAKKLSYRYNN